MGLFNLFGKKKQPEQSLDLPPPPSPDAPMPTTDIRVVEDLPELEKRVPMVVPMPEADDAPEHIVSTREMAPPMPEDVHIEETPTHRNRAEPLFVSVQDYQEVLGSISYIRNKLGESEELVKKLNEVKAREEKEFDNWRNQLEDLQRKLTYVEDVIATAG